MGEDSVKRLFERFDDLNARIARMEVKVDMIEKTLGNLRDSIANQGTRLGTLEQAKAGARGIADFIPWITAIAVAIWGAMK